MKFAKKSELYQPTEFVTTAGGGTMMSLGIVDTVASAQAYAAKDALKQKMIDGHQVTLHADPAGPDCVTGK